MKALLTQGFGRDGQGFTGVVLLVLSAYRSCFTGFICLSGFIWVSEGIYGDFKRFQAGFGFAFGF